ncbi:unnamed protein product [Linum tenue]|uniref:Uncharacterized protein n=1 Tax=Linum tenue TaxID=586396 RepID=A0AAV0JCM3_9ROSI|nr:unnamed protein product [Linum tenue]
MSTASSSVDVYVHDYTGDIYDPDLIRYKDNGRWGNNRIKIGPSADAQFKALEVHGVVIEGNQLTQLWNDLTLTAPDGQKFCLTANRSGICYLLVNSPSVMRLRVNDYFGWAKYGVKPPISTSTIWTKCDLSSGATLVDVGQLLKNKEKETVEEKSKELEAKEKEVVVMRKLVERSKEVETLWERSVEEKDNQLAMLMERNEEVESLWEKSVQEKDRQLAMWEKSVQEKDKQLVKLMDAMQALIYEV